jgi:hypothetical protein
MTTDGWEIWAVLIGPWLTGALIWLSLPLVAAVLLARGVVWLARTAVDSRRRPAPVEVYDADGDGGQDGLEEDDGVEPGFLYCERCRAVCEHRIGQ